MEGYQALPDHILLTENSGSITLEDHEYVIGASIEILSDSDADLLHYGIGESPIVPLRKGEGARGYGGFHSCGIPCYYRGSFKWKYDADETGKALLIITRLIPTAKEVK